MILINLAFKSLWNRRATTLLTVFSISLSVALLLSVEKIRKSAEEGFTQSISQVDLIVGARSGPINLLLYSVFNIGAATNNISWQTFTEYKNNPSVEWVIPYSLGDSHRGFRVVGTDETFFQHYRFRGTRSIEFASGEIFKGIWGVVLGSEVAKTLSYKLGDKIVVTHGVTRGEGVVQHDDKPFSVTGILKTTGTSIDRSVYISLYGMEALHIDWSDGAVPTATKQIGPDQIKIEDLKINAITAFFLRTKSRIETLKLQRNINEYKNEPLLAIIPGVTLGELWNILGYVEQAFRITTWFVLLIGLAAMLVSLMSSLNERRREMAILRSIGAPPQFIVGLLVLESGLLSVSGILFGFIFQFALFAVLSVWIEQEFGFVFSSAGISPTELIYLLITFVLGIGIGLVPALKAQMQALKDGLTIRI